MRTEVAAEIKTRENWDLPITHVYCHSVHTHCSLLNMSEVPISISKHAGIQHIYRPSYSHRGGFPVGGDLPISLRRMGSSVVQDSDTDLIPFHNPPPKKNHFTYFTNWKQTFLSPGFYPPRTHSSPASVMRKLWITNTYCGIEGFQGSTASSSSLRISFGCLLHLHGSELSPESHFLVFQLLGLLSGGSNLQVRFLLVILWPVWQSLPIGVPENRVKQGFLKLLCDPHISLRVLGISWPITAERSYCPRDSPHLLGTACPFLGSSPCRNIMAAALVTQALETTPSHLESPQHPTTPTKSAPSFSPASPISSKIAPKVHHCPAEVDLLLRGTLWGKKTRILSRPWWGWWAVVASAGVFSDTVCTFACWLRIHVCGRVGLSVPLKPGNVSLGLTNGCVVCPWAGYIYLSRWPDFPSLLKAQDLLAVS